MKKNLSRNAKKAIRARMARTGEKYMTAQRNWLAERDQRSADAETAPGLAEPQAATRAQP